MATNDPSKAAVELRRYASRLNSLCNDLEYLEEPLADENVEALDTAFQKLVKAEKAAKLASNVILDNGQALAGTGSEPWEILLRSAMKFAAEVAYPGEAFPGPTTDAKCVLCQQSLAPEAKERLVRFAAFLESDAQRQVNEHRQQGKVLYKAMKAVDFTLFPSDDVFMDELEDKYPELHNAIGEFVTALVERKTSILEMAPTKSLNGLPSLPDSPSFYVHELKQQKLTQAGALEAQMSPEVRFSKTKRLAELNAREKLNELLGTISDAITALAVAHAYSEASRACSTNAVTRKMNELYEETVTAELRDALLKECQALGVRSEILGLDMSGQKGARMQKLKLAAAPKFARVKPSAVLSEGEQRAVAIATFLAEVGIEGNGSGIVLDDPVSSLDQVRKERIAKRLIQEAKHRQVIVFTHDLSFAWTLRDQAELNGVVHEERFVFQSGGGTGYVQTDLPFEAKKLDARVNALKDQAKAARKVLETDKNFDAYNDKARQLYRRMRDTWELVVEDLLFNSSVKRFRRSIQTQQLASVLVDDDDVKEVYLGMTRCSSFTHEGGAEDPPALPDPDGLDADLATLTTSVARLKGRLEVVKKRRKENGLLA